MSDTIDHKTPRVGCPVCLNPLDCATETPGPKGAPEPGDLSLCLFCAALLVYDPDMSLRKITMAEWNALTPQGREYVSRVRNVTRRIIQRPGRKGAPSLNPSPSCAWDPSSTKPR